MKGHYNTIQDFLQALNVSGVEYIVLRNYEKMLDSEMYMDGHGDVDLLCAESRLMAKAIGAKSYHHEDGIHYYVNIAGENVSLDLRSLGDGYYCTQWQKEMLRTKVQENGMWVMDQMNYLYSLIYHSVLQKRALSKEYALRLKDMAYRQGIVLNTVTEKEFIYLLERFMTEKGYKYVYPKDYMVPLRTNLINKHLLFRDYSLAYGHWIFDTKVKTIEFLVKLKHLLEGKGFRYA